MNFSLGLVEVSSLGNAIIMLDEMLKVADVEFVATERKLGGRLVTIVVRGSISSVTTSVETGKRFAESLGCLKSAEVIARPHPEILKFIHLDEENEPKANAESAETHTGSVPAKKPELKAQKTGALTEKAKTPAKTETKAEKPATKETTKTTKTTKTVSKAEKASDIKNAPKKTGKKTK